MPDDPGGYVLETYCPPGDRRRRATWSVSATASPPRYLADQLEGAAPTSASTTIDVYYLHNPETQLAEVDRPTFLGRMRAAF